MKKIIVAVLAVFFLLMGGSAKAQIKGEVSPNGKMEAFMMSTGVGIGESVPSIGIAINNGPINTAVIFKGKDPRTVDRDAGAKWSPNSRYLIFRAYQDNPEGFEKLFYMFGVYDTQAKNKSKALRTFDLGLVAYRSSINGNILTYTLILKQRQMTDKELSERKGECKEYHTIYKLMTATIDLANPKAKQKKRYHEECGEGFE